MRKFWEDKREYKKIQEADSKCKQELDCEEALINEKKRFGRARKVVMNYLRSKYGTEMTNRVQGRINKRRNF